ncbi:MAG TPA: aminoacyl-tRNA hydrolase [Blastocatellia bacterium]|nr:aminoacyl-tRNA hydrolase [Blastocatellia bacterium]
MKLVVGLGNPGAEYECTRHNLGFLLVDLLAERARCRVVRLEDQALVGRGRVGGVEVTFAKPQTFMNLSGDSVKALVKRYDADPASDLVVAVDDVALPFGRIRIRKTGTSGGHNGLKSIIGRLGSQDFSRVRLGIAPDHPIEDMARFVLQPFPRAAREQVDRMLWTAADAVETILTEGADAAMQRFNGDGG